MVQLPDAVAVLTLAHIMMYIVCYKSRLHLNEPKYPTTC